MLKIVPLITAKVNPIVKIVSSYSGFGGSTILFIELCKLFNQSNIPTVFYGPNQWHLNNPFCQHISDLKIAENDNIIYHLPRPRPFTPQSARKVVLSIHEKGGHILVPDQLKVIQTIVFASESQKQWHGYYKGPQDQLVIPTPHCQLNKVVRRPEAENVAGIIGQISFRKQTHVSILRALQDGYKVIIFGPKSSSNSPTDFSYFNYCVAPLIGKNVFYYGEIQDKQKMYEMVSCVYQSSIEESACLVQAECEMVGIPFHGNCNIVPYEIWPPEKIVGAWKEVLEI